MNYKGFKEFPFPSIVPKGEEKIKEFFFSLPNDKQLEMLKGSSFYELFLDRVSQYMVPEQNMDPDARMLAK